MRSTEPSVALLERGRLAGTDVGAQPPVLADQVAVCALEVGDAVSVVFVRGLQLLQALLRQSELIAE